MTEARYCIECGLNVTAREDAEQAHEEFDPTHKPQWRTA